MNPTKHASPESLKVCTPEDNTRQDRYIHFRFNGEEFPLAREEAWRIQAEGYRSMGFVTGKAIDERGFLYPEIDKSRGIPGSEYYIVISDAEEDDRATLRKVPPRPFCDYTSLPAYESTKDTLYPLGKKLLENLHLAGNDIKEISALAKTEHASPLAIFELFREIIQDAHTKNEVWFFSVVSTTFSALVKNMGKCSFTVIGGDVNLDDPRVNPDITLRPALFMPGPYYQNLMADIKSAKDYSSRKRLIASLEFFSEGLRDPKLTEQISTFLGQYS